MGDCNKRLRAFACDTVTILLDLDRIAKAYLAWVDKPHAEHRAALAEKRDAYYAALKKQA